MTYHALQRPPQPVRCQQLRASHAAAGRPPLCHRRRFRTARTAAAAPPSPRPTVSQLPARVAVAGAAAAASAPATATATAAAHPAALCGGPAAPPARSAGPLPPAEQVGSRWPAGQPGRLRPALEHRPQQRAVLLLLLWRLPPAVALALKALQRRPLLRLRLQLLQPLRRWVPRLPALAAAADL